MILHCILFDRESFKDQKYTPTEFEYTLTKRQIKDIFNNVQNKVVDTEIINHINRFIDIEQNVIFNLLPCNMYVLSIVYYLIHHNFIYDIMGLLSGV